MTLEKRTKPNQYSNSVLTECPVEGCNTEFADYSACQRRNHLLKEHDPEDFGL